MNVRTPPAETLVLPRTLLVLLLVAWGSIGLCAAVSAQDDATGTSCEICHADADLFEPEQLAILEQHAQSVHGAVGLSCHDCHGGNPDPALADDMFAAKDEQLPDHAYVGAPARAEIPEFCGACHSDPAYMNRFDPDLRTDQELEYWTSHHGRKLREGDLRVATCVSCHGNHDTVAADEPGSKTYPTRVAETCGACHSDATLMAGSVLADGRALPIDQYALWGQSVHAEALLEREDLSAPTCNDCHGNHGATPPGLESLGFVCGQCHGRQAELFRASNKRDLLIQHADYLADAGDEGCASCHEPPEPQVELTDLRTFGECDSCHRHHAIQRPSVAMLSPLPETPCAFCHEPVDGESTALDPAASGERYAETRDGLLADAPVGLDADRLFDWLVDQTVAVSFHTIPGAEGAPPTLRPEFRRLFEKFRIGKTHFLYQDPATGEDREGQVRRCGHCHGPEPVLGVPTGYQAGREALHRIRELTTQAAQAERTMLRARRGGVETREAQREIEQAVDAQIELEVLLHSFSLGEDGDFVAKQEEGMEHASLALVAARSSLAELDFRRSGLLVFLGFVVLAMIGLAMKIRDLS